MTAVYVIFAVLLFLLILLLIPISVELDFESEIKYRVKVAGITVYNSEKPPKKHKKAKKSDKNVAENTPDTPPKKQNFFSRLKKEKGFSGAVKYTAGLAGIILKKIGWLLRRLRFKKFVLEITVASDDAAVTALEYGTVCTAVYPVISFLVSKARFKAKSVDISADFDVTCPRARLSFAVTTELIIPAIALICGMKEYKKYKKESENK